MTHSLHTRPEDTMLEQNTRAFEFAKGLEVGHDPKGRYRERSRYANRYGERYGERYGVGAQTTTGQPPARKYLPDRTGGGTQPPPTGDPPPRRGDDDCGPGDIVCNPWATGQTGAAHGRRVYYNDQKYSCAIRPPRCDCQVIGGNTTNSTVFPLGIPSGTFGTVTLDSGDASFFVPYYMHIVALEVGAVVTLAVTGVPQMVLMQDSTSGREPNMRRASTTNPSFGVPTLVYGQEKELECVDWNRFASINNQQLQLTFFNPQTVAVHIFVNLWGLVAA